MEKTLIGFFLTGILFGSGLCLASCGPILISYVAASRKNIASGIIFYAIFSLVRVAAYVMLGSAIFFLGRLATQVLMERVAGYFFIAAGLFVIIVGLLVAFGEKGGVMAPFSKMPHAEKVWALLQSSMIRRDKKSAAILGLIVGFLPCAPLLALFSYASLIAPAWSWIFFYVLAFGVGTILSPLAILTTFAGTAARFLLDRKGLYGAAFNVLCGAVIIILGLQLVWRGLVQ